jgi:hypothetical protein
MAQSESQEKIVPVEIVEDQFASMGGKRAGSSQFRIVLSSGLRIEVESGFDAAELRRLIAALDCGELHGRVSRAA